MWYWLFIRTDMWTRLSITMISIMTGHFTDILKLLPWWNLLLSNFCSLRHHISIISQSSVYLISLWTLFIRHFKIRKANGCAVTERDNLNEPMLALLCLVLCITPALHLPSQHYIRHRRKQNLRKFLKLFISGKFHYFSSYSTIINSKELYYP